MSKLDELIKKLCPDGVDFYRINDLVDIITPRNKIKKKDYQSSGRYPIIDQGQDFIGGYTDNTGALVKDEYVIFGDHTCVVKYVNFQFCQGADGIKILKAKNKILSKYLFYCMNNIKLDSSYKRHWSKMKNEFIPIPPLEVQSEIVKILDDFTELTAELTTELTAELTTRKKQYEYYRDRLLTFDIADSIQKVKLGDVAKVTKLAGFEFTKYVTYAEKGHIIALRGLNVKNGKLDLSDVKYIDGSDLSKLERSRLHVGDMLFTYVGTVGQVALIDKENTYYLAPNVALVRADKNILLPEYMRYYFQSSLFWDTQIKKLLQSSSMKNIPMEKIRKFELLIPPIGVQRRLVNVLDNFDTVCNDLHIGLPAEIEARKKQYAFYRDSLLTFLEKGETVLTDRQTDRQTDRTKVCPD